MLSPGEPLRLPVPGAAGPAGSWCLAPGQALSLYPRQNGILRISSGRAWVTLDLAPRGPVEEAGDHDLHAGQQLSVAAGRHLVFEPLDAAPVWFEWMPAPMPVPLKAERWEISLVQPLSDLAQAARLAAGALLRLGLGLLLSPPRLLAPLRVVALPRRRRL